MSEEQEGVKPETEIARGVCLSCGVPEGVKHLDECDILPEVRTPEDLPLKDQPINVEQSQIAIGDDAHAYEDYELVIRTPSLVGRVIMTPEEQDSLSGLLQRMTFMRL